MTLSLPRKWRLFRKFWLLIVYESWASLKSTEVGQVDNGFTSKHLLPKIININIFTTFIVLSFGKN